MQVHTTCRASSDLSRCKWGSSEGPLVEGSLVEGALVGVEGGGEGTKDISRNLIKGRRDRGKSVQSTASHSRGPVRKET